MTKLRYLLSGILMLIALSAATQSPGFAGKHFSVNGGMGITPAFYNWVYDNDLYDGISTLPGIGMNVTPAIGAEYVLTKGLVLGGNFMFNSLNNPMHYFEDGRIFNDYEAHGYFGETKVKSKYFGVYLKFYKYKKKGAIAPIGRFQQLEFIKGSSTLENGDVVVTNEDSYELYAYLWSNSNYYFESFNMVDDISKVGFTDPVKQTYIKYAYGYETVLFDKIAATLSVQASYPLNKLFLSDESLNEAESQFNEDVRNRAWGALGFSMNLGIGYFIF